MTDLNPYEPTLPSDTTKTAPQNRFSAMVLVAGTLGAVSVLLALKIVSETYGISRRQGGLNDEIGKGYVVAAGFLVLGAGWAVAAWLYWKQRKRTATAVAFGILASAGLFLFLLEKGIVP